MGKKSKRNHRAAQSTAPRPAPPARHKRRYGYIAAAIGILVAIAVLWFEFGAKADVRSEAELAALHRPQAATTGNPAAKVHIVEFLDPACETCREFYPFVKGMMRDHPGAIQLTVRLVAFHPNADLPVRALEASKAQGKFWDLLDSLLESQPLWVENNRVDVDKFWRELHSLDLNLDRLRADMESPAVRKAVAVDAADANTLKVTQTPEYFVNGRGLPEFGFRQLQHLVDEELKATR